jgi:hypothetical protein
MMHKSLSLLVLLIPLANAYASEDALRKIKTEVEATTNNNAPKINEYFEGDKNSEVNKITGYDPNASINGKEMPIEQAEGLGHAARQQEYNRKQDYKCNKERCEVGHTFSTYATLEREKQAEIVGFQRNKNGEIKRNKGYMDKALETVRNSKNNFDYLKGEYADCKPDNDVTTVTTEERCEQFYDIKKNSCFANQVVEIDPKYTYQCNKKRDIKEKLCTDILKKLTCKQNAECDSGGIILKGLASDMQWSYRYPLLTLGTIADNYWRSGCGKFDRNTTFEVKNKNQIQEFRIVQLGFDDYLRVTINGVQIYNEPYGGDLLAIERGLVAKTNSQLEKMKKHQGWMFTSGGYSCELNTSNSISVNIDLLPYLKEGMNEIKIEVVVAGAGEGWIQIRTKQHCCTEWIEERDEKCNIL